MFNRPERFEAALLGSLRQMNINPDFMERLPFLTTRPFVNDGPAALGIKEFAHLLAHNTG